MNLIISSILRHCILRKITTVYFFKIFYSVTFVSCDTGMMGQLIKMEVLTKLEAEYGKDVFRNDNLVLSATHTHSGPAGYMQYLMYTISSFGFVEDCFQVIFISIPFLRFHQSVKYFTTNIFVILIVIIGNRKWNRIINKTSE